jgi:hypothetical protein
MSRSTLTRPALRSTTLARQALTGPSTTWHGLIFPDKPASLDQNWIAKIWLCQPWQAKPLSGKSWLCQPRLDPVPYISNLILAAQNKLARPCICIYNTAICTSSLRLPYGLARPFVAEHWTSYTTPWQDSPWLEQLWLDQFWLDQQWLEIPR